MKNKLALIIVVLLVVSTIYYLQSTTPKVERKELAMTVADKEGKYPKAIELVSPEGYINTDPNITIKSLIGKKVILVDFWTYSCINCIRTLPYLTSWHEKYKDQGLEIIGVHTPEFDFEADYNNLLRAVTKHGIKYPVVQDNHYQTWTAYQNRFWPHKYLIDIDGYIVYDHIGEGAYDETEKKIQELLAERANRLGIEMQMNETMVKPETASVEFEKIRSPEIYLGYQTTRGYFGNPEGFIPNEVVKYTLPANLEKNQVYLEGNWKNNPDNIEMAGTKGKIVLIYDAKLANIVASSSKPLTITTKLDGKEHRTIQITASDLYRAAEADDYGEHRLEINILSPGFRIYTFTFG